MRLTHDDHALLAEKGISEAQIVEQLQLFAAGFPYLRLYAAASVEKGILSLTDAAQQHYVEAWEAYMHQGKTIVKFVPASGAASRMFKDLFAFLTGENDAPTTPFEKTFFMNLTKFAFYDALDAACQQYEGKNMVTLLAEGRHKAIVQRLLMPEGLNYGNLPKGLLLFHRYDTGAVRTPFEEHLVEAAAYACAENQPAHVHFTVSAEHRKLFEKLVKEQLPAYATANQVQYDISFSEQKACTDTIAADEHNQAFRENGKLVFRPGGHGALIANLNDLDADIIFIKNIDNVVPDKLKSDTTHYKKLIAGVLVDIQTQIFAYLQLLEGGQYTHEQVMEVVQFVQKYLCCKNPDIKYLEDSELVIYLKGKLNRPIRVCGMVKNVGEPGGGPFLAYNADGTIALQILESSQINMDDPNAREMFEKGTHFNPVDLVCGVRDYRGEKFDLTKFVDPATGFISTKSKGGQTLKALELPGLWNGAMSDWNTIFVEVPLSTFNPVKTVNDLLRDQHQ